MEYIHRDVFEASRDKHDFIIWLDEENFISISYRKCDVCHERMHLTPDASCIDNFCMCCENAKCNARQSIRRGSFFENEDLPILGILNILINFVVRIPPRCTSLGFSFEYNTVCALYRKALEWWSADLRRRPILFKANTEYEVKETLVKDVETANGHERRDIWVGGILERDTRKCKLYMLRSRTSDEIFPHIVESIPAGSLVYTKEADCYAQLDATNAAYQHYSVNHSRREYSREEDLGDGEKVNVHVNGVEGVFVKFRAKLRDADRRCENTVQLCLDEVMCRNSGRSLFYPFKTFPDPY